MRVMILCTAAFVVPGPVAIADSVTLSTSPDPREDSQIVVHVEGQASDERGLAVGWSSTGECSRAISYPDVLGEDVSGSFSFDEPTSLEDPGDWVLCAALRTDGRTFAGAQIPVAVRGNRAEIRLLAPPAIPLGERVPIGVGGSSELGRGVTVQVVAGSSCGTDPVDWLDAAVHTSWDTRPGAFARTVRVDVEEYGRYSLCAFVEEGSGFAGSPVEAVASQLLFVTPRCTREWPRLWRAQWQLTRARRVLDAALPPLRALRARVRLAERALLRARVRRGAACSAPRGHQT